MSFVYMKILESRPHRYDVGMALSTLGGLSRTKRYIASHILSGDKVLDLGCGTGTLVEMCVERGAIVSGLDANKGMLAIAKERAPSANLISGNLIDIDELFESESFDVIVSTLVFSELNKEEREYILTQANRILKKNGRLYIADEVVPNNMIVRLLHRLLRAPLALLTWVITQNTTKAILRFDAEISHAGFSVNKQVHFIFGLLTLVEAEKCQTV